MKNKIGELQKDNQGREYRIIKGKKIYQMEIRSERDRIINDNINEWRAR